MHCLPFDLLTQFEILLKIVSLVDILFKFVVEKFLREVKISFPSLKSENAQSEVNRSELSVVKKRKNLRTWKGKGRKKCLYPLK